MIDNKKVAVGKGDLNAYLGAGCTFKGKLKFKGMVLIEGSVEGKISAGEVLIVGKQGKVKGEVKADEVEVGGIVDGKLAASRKVAVKSGGKVIGSLETPSLAVEDGGYLHGECHMESQPPKGTPSGPKAEKNP